MKQSIFSFILFAISICPICFGQENSSEGGFYGYEIDNKGFYFYNDEKPLKEKDEKEMKKKPIKKKVSQKS